MTDTNGNPVGGYGWVSVSGTGGSFVFSGLTPLTDYKIKARVPATTSYPKSLESAGTEVRTLGIITVTEPVVKEADYDGAH